MLARWSQGMRSRTSTTTQQPATASHPWLFFGLCQRGVGVCCYGLPARPSHGAAVAPRVFYGATTRAPPSRPARRCLWVELNASARTSMGLRRGCADKQENDLLTFIGWLLAAVAAFIFVVGIVGMFAPSLFQAPNEQKPPSRLMFLLSAWLLPIIPGGIAFAILVLG